MFDFVSKPGKHSPRRIHLLTVTGGALSCRRVGRENLGDWLVNVTLANKGYQNSAAVATIESYHMTDHLRQSEKLHPGLAGCTESCLMLEHQALLLLRVDLVEQW